MRYRIDWRNDYAEDVIDEFQHIEINGYTGKWSALEKIYMEQFDCWYYIFEHDFYGDETCYLVCKVENGLLSDDEPFETYDGLIQCLVDEDIIWIP